MELFRINCVTCQAGLSVRNEAIIGTIIACPKCGSMVEVARPDTPEVEPNAPSTAADAPVEPLPTVEISTGSSFVTWVMCAAAVGMTLVAGLTWWLTSGDEPQIVATPAQQASPTSVMEATSIEPTELEPEPEPEPVLAEADAEIFEATEESAAKEPIVEVAALPTPPPVVAADTETPEEKLPSESIKKIATVPNPPRHVFNALDLDPESMQLGSLGRNSEQPDQPLIEETTHSQHANVMEPEVSTLPVARRGRNPDDGVATRQAADQFALELSSLEFRDMPLVSFLQMISRLSGVPVSVSAEQLRMAGISPRKEVSFDARNVTLDAALRQVLEPIRLEHRFARPQVIVTRQDADLVREIDYPLDDLTDSAADSEQLLAWIEQLVTPGSWEQASHELRVGKLRVRQSQRVHYELLTFLERLRMVRDLETRSRFPITRLAPTPLHAAMTPRLTRPALFTFTQDTPLEEVVGHWQRELEVPLLVDWPALAEINLWPDTPIVCAIADRNWQQALTAVLQPLGLEWRVCFCGGIEISTATKFQADRQLELYRLTKSQDDDGRQLLAELRQHLSSLPSAGASQLAYDAQGPALIALLDASAQRELLHWLVERKLFRVE